MTPEETNAFNDTIKRLMMEMEKEDIYAAASYHHLEITEEMDKADMAAVFSEVLVENFETDCQHMLENEFYFITSLYLHFEKDSPSEGKTILKAILEANHYEINDTDGDYFVDRGYFQQLRTDDTHTTLYMYPPIMKSFLTQFVQLMETTRQNERKLALILALTNLYGCCSYTQYVHIWNLYNEEQITSEEAEVFFTAMEGRRYHIWQLDNYVINDIITVEELAQLLAESRDRPWYTPSEVEIEANVQLINPKSSEYKQFESFFKRHKGNIKTKKQLREILWDLTFEMKYATPPSVVFDILSDRNYVFKNDKSAQEFLEIFQKISDNSRKWPLRGFTPKDSYHRD